MGRVGVQQHDGGVGVAVLEVAWVLQCVQRDFHPRRVEAAGDDVEEVVYDSAFGAVDGAREAGVWPVAAAEAV